MAMEDRLRLRLELEELYAAYADALDSGDYDSWPEFFTDDCVYQVIARENHEQGLPLAAIRCESKGMLMDRVHAVKTISMYAPRSLRHLVSGLNVTAAETESTSDAVTARASFCILETLIDEPTRVFMSGRYLDKLVRIDSRLKFSERICVFDSDLVLNTLVMPI